MVIQPRDNDTWWVDQYGRRRSNFWLWREEQAGDLSKVMVDEDSGVRVEATEDGNLLHLMQIPSHDTLAATDHRALLTDSERELIENPSRENDDRREQAIARIRWRILRELPADIELLKNHQPSLYGQLRDTICEADT